MLHLIRMRSTSRLSRSPQGTLTLRVNKAGVQVFGVVLENAGKAMTAHELLELKAESSDLVVPVGTRGQAARDLGFRLGRVAGKLLRATRQRMGKS
jgi:hypothetical protein